MAPVGEATVAGQDDGDPLARQSGSLFLLGYPAGTKGEQVAPSTKSDSPSTSAVTAAFVQMIARLAKSFISINKPDLNTFLGLVAVPAA
jgi:hypothetical protein